MRISLLASALIALGAFSAKAETLVVGSTPTGVPFTFLDVEKNEITGMMVDVAKAIGVHEGFDATVQATDWVSLIPALTSGRIDMISAAMSGTDERRKVIDFSEPIYTYGEGLVQKADDATRYTAALTETQGKKIGVQQGVLYLPALQERTDIGELRVYESVPDMIRDLQLGRIQVGFVDRPTMSYQIAAGKYPGLAVSESYESQYTAPIAIAVRKDNPELLARVNDGLAKIKSSGELDSIIAKWNLE